MKGCVVGLMALGLLAAACQVPGVKEVEEKVNGISSQVTQLRDSGQELGSRLDQLEYTLGSIQIPEMGDLEFPDFGTMVQEMNAHVEGIRQEMLEEIQSDRAEIDSLQQVITGLEEELASLSSRITTLENRPSGTSGGSTGGSTGGRGDTSGGGRGGTSGGGSTGGR